MSTNEDQIRVEKRDGQYEVSHITNNRAFVRIRYTRAELKQLVEKATWILENDK